jgi:hypothetical protein
MADTKITALTAITTVDPAADVLPIVDVSDTSMAASGTTKKITSNQILGAGGTATLASATITGDLTVDTSTLKVDSTNNRVGIGTATPARPLDIVGSFQSTLGWVLTGTPAGLGAATRYIGGASTTDSWYYNAVSGGSHVWAFGESESMRLNSTGLGVGASPSYKFHVAGAPAATSGSLIFVRDTTANGSNTSLGSVVFASSPGTDFYVGKKSVNFATSLSIGNANTGVEYFQIDTSGNVGIGVTPSAWNTGRAIEFGGGSVYTDSGNNECSIAQGAYNNSGWKYKYTGVAAGLATNYGGTHAWYTAPSGTAGTAITFTQAMTLDASGNLLVGTTTTSGNAGGLKLSNVSGNRGEMTLDASGNLLVGTTGQNGSWNTKLTLSNDSGTTKWAVGPYLGGVTNFIISAGASTGVYLNGTAATSWTSASDERLKDIIEPISNAASKVASLRAVIGKFKFDENNTRKPFLIAQDIQAVLPEAVDASNPDRLGVAYTDVIPLLVAAIKELTTRVQTLEAR